MKQIEHAGCELPIGRHNRPLCYLPARPSFDFERISFLDLLIQCDISEIQLRAYKTHYTHIQGFSLTKCNITVCQCNHMLVKFHLVTFQVPLDFDCQSQELDTTSHTQGRL